MQVKSPHRSTAELLTLSPDQLMQLPSESQDFLLESEWNKTTEEPEKLQQLQTLHSQQTSLGENRPTVSINTGWGFLEPWQSFGTNRQTAPSSTESGNITSDLHFSYEGFLDGVLLPSWGRTRPQSHHLLAWRRPFLPTAPPCGRTPESASAADHQVAPQCEQRKREWERFLPFHPDGLSPAKLLLPGLVQLSDDFLRFLRTEPSHQGSTRTKESLFLLFTYVVVVIHLL